MKDIIEKLKSMINTLEEKHGSLSIFALFLREDFLDRWDVFVSASWLNSKEMEGYNIISSTLRDTLDDSELVLISRIVILDQDNSTVAYLQSLKIISNGGFEELSKEELSDKFNFTIKKAYLLRSQKITS